VTCLLKLAQEQIVYRSGSKNSRPGRKTCWGWWIEDSDGTHPRNRRGQHAQELLRKRKCWCRHCRQRDHVLNAEVPPENASGSSRSSSPAPTLWCCTKVVEANIVTSLRTDRKGQHYLRLSPHFYNTDADCTRVVDMLPASSS